MAAINVPTRDEVSPANQAIFDELAKRRGKVPNYATFAHSENALATYLALQNAKSRGEYRSDCPLKLFAASSDLADGGTALERQLAPSHATFSARVR